MVGEDAVVLDGLGDGVQVNSAATGCDVLTPGGAMRMELVTSAGQALAPSVGSALWTG